ncbi:adenine phosphoribosyltransferase 3-like [Diaphorina citri]|uniref:adenine phosphoribosyltransferase n=1 Tax=Diaphorina citri TaxID=121845 RepID=A0A3Q0J486_DIACI|nr:adenine phosphoribosyltransferase 3-like [Diaphorina citri]
MIKERGSLAASCQLLTTLGVDVVECFAVMELKDCKASKKALIVDDLIATGGSLAASCQLLTTLGVDVVECFAVMELKDLNGRQKVPSKVVSLLEF